MDPGRPRFVPNTAKAVEVILWLATERPGIDIYHLVKAAFFADKDHVAHYGRPICGDVYRADTYGPLPAVIYGLLRHDPLEMLALGGNGPLPFRVSDDYTVRADRDPNLRWLSDSDQASLRGGLHAVSDKSFNELVQITHDDPAYINADGGVIDYRDLLPSDDPDRDAKGEDMRETAPCAVF